MCDMGNMHFTSEAFEMSCQETFMTNYVVEQIDHPVLITECLLDPVQSRSKMAELLFSTYGVPSVEKVEEKDNDQGKGEDTSDAKDEDRQLYKLMSKDNDDDDKGLDEDETELACVSSRLQPEPGPSQPAADEPHSRPLTKEDFQVLLGVERSQPEEITELWQLMPFFVNATLSNTNEIFLSYFYICFAMNSELFQVSVLIFQLSLDLHFISHGIVCPDFVVTPSS
ncbi:hypothetical protein NC653_020369 [Populus alba x Populus x berolinensis]|uniref:Uncharacterized protein n=1 Tax=Populus alba x Populus x berolinensis TaxID=444605 RepID=A0AAD6MMN5_9ROSI|nr:hypothetical protein NC653_020369 [Populus alba x Populus x berolinensis]